MKNKNVRFGAVFCSAVLALMASVTCTQAQSVVRLHGAITIEKLITAQKQAIETQSGVKIETIGNGSGRGLADLSGGLADIAMIGGSLKGVADASNTEKPGSVVTAGLSETLLCNMKLAIVSHSGVGVKSLTEAQVKDIFTGTTKNWKDVGGPDLAIKVVLPFLGDGARISIQEEVLKDASFTKDAILRNSAKDVPVVLSQLPGACSFLTVKNADATMATIAVDKELLMPMKLITKGEPTGDVKKVVDVLKGIIK